MYVCMYGVWISRDLPGQTALFMRFCMEYQVLILVLVSTAIDQHSSFLYQGMSASPYIYLVMRPYRQKYTAKF